MFICRVQVRIQRGRVPGAWHAFDIPWFGEVHFFHYLGLKTTAFREYVF
jgi:hypothetical protein